MHWESKSTEKISVALELLMQRAISSSERDVSNRGRKAFAGRMAQRCLVRMRAVTQRENSQGLERAGEFSVGEGLPRMYMTLG